MTEQDMDSTESDFQSVLDECVSSLEMDDETDSQLLTILSKSVVKLSPNENAVVQALKEIEALADKRAECGG
ncbi:MAG: hypothetical protein OXD31_09805 [Chloroflexi bacterium]|nr:hypothetical protein [Chloroflexota bacterium]